jgi:hypothetical protein
MAVGKPLGDGQGMHTQVNRKRWRYGLAVAVFVAGLVLVANDFSGGFGWALVVFGSTLAAMLFDHGSQATCGTRFDRRGRRDVSPAAGVRPALPQTQAHDQLNTALAVTPRRVFGGRARFHWRRSPQRPGFESPAEAVRR